MNNKKDPFEYGVLCFVVRRRYRGKGKPILIMHEAKMVSVSKKIGGFGYGVFRTWTTPKETKRK